MRTAVLRINIDPAGELADEQLAQGVSALRAGVAAWEGEVLGGGDLPAAPPNRREVQLLVATDDADGAHRAALELCARAFGTEPAAGVVTFISRGTDDDAHGVLAGFGLTAEVVRTQDADGFDVVSVIVAKEDLERVPESRLHTALEASLNCEVTVLAK
ncbi:MULTISPECIES: hypothetical protein [Nocardia]|uniref:hypothetical protein n=1 Tax=Nocardia TaxID=1817 RepID=UPI000D69BFD6|nr:MULTISPECIES: hypothetical protein [Nocardia]